MSGIFTMKRWILIALGVLAFVVAAGAWYSFSSPLRISSQEAKRRIKNHEIDRIVDVRTDAEVELIGSYPGAIHIPSAELPVRAASSLGKNDRILLYCNTGQRARAAAEKLQSLGYSNVRYIAGPHTTLM